ncbi:heterogeneous nuclear ribonucleoprotein R-like isoform X1 [Uloborus diversus]|uniref:heterogeneous nuclear ribonucleoprotein R-like isoform X1 n=1 Tax=Uloborus diversus TaxID=327109 RepID=UPI00240A3029|nr:heterogeneous nuclear ribonucleoprotein R-like isoform X1 [Uloborus diversus]XP_054718865.1 heterogeneous nuclear ribonucleoprotein R-like isoform X1 [Uloborus diversus]XP_054718866.1 heterogeneous nuclear ribonucleoprotein R-like isoform X1 [Uloborus diversus]XP_054718867.1 heterogeneous nuclear ribonucleoprotein R-like isoform X1 [Uloborus diversus]
MAENNEVNDQEMTEEKNGEAMETDSKSKELADYGLAEKVVSQLEEIFTTGKLTFSELDERALEALKEFPVEGALSVLKEFMEINLEHVSNKSAYLCGIMKTYRQKTKMGTPAVTTKGPDEEKIKAILERTGYTLDVTTGQRKYGGPPPNWEQPPPSSGCEVFVGKIPKTIYEDELIPVFEKCGQIWDLRLMMDPLTGQNRGYAFITYCNRESAQGAVKQLDNYEIKPGKNLKVNVSVPNLRLFVGNIPKSKSKEEIFEEFSKLTVGLMEVIIYSSPDDKRKNRGFCFLEYESHKAASLGKRKLGTGRTKVWGCDIIVDWADPQEEPDEETMSKVKVLYARNLTAELNEEKLKEMFEEFGKVERIKKIKDYAFIHFAERDPAVKAMEEINGKQFGGSTVEVSLAKPPSDKKKKEEVLRNRERRMMQTFGRGGMMVGMLPTPPRSRGGRVPQNPQRSFDYDYDYYGYGDYPGGGYGEPYYDDFYSAPPYEDYSYDYGYATPPRPYPSRVAPPPERVPRGGGRIARSTPPRSSRGSPPGRGRGAKGGTRGLGKAGGRGGNRPRGTMAGKRKFDSGHQNQGASKRRFQNSRGAMGNSWGNQPIPQQPRGASGGDVEWYQDSFGQQWG